MNRTEPKHLFVYGTLMRASRSPYAALLSTRAQFVGEGWTPGLLYNLGRFPGAVFSEDCSSKVHGELFALRGGSLLAALDRYEGCDGQGSKVDLFYRDIAVVRDARRALIAAWVYPFAGSTNGRPIIVSGRFSLR